MHCMLSEIFLRLDNGATLEAQALTCQCRKACHQTLLDEGEWRTSWLLTTLPDPLMRSRFGGTEKELEAVAAYARSLDLLEQTVRRDRGRDHEDDDRGGTQAKGRGRGKGADKGAKE